MDQIKELFEQIGNHFQAALDREAERQDWLAGRLFRCRGCMESYPKDLLSQDGLCKWCDDEARWLARYA
jgi:hypothetical protein